MADLVVPQLGESISEALVARWLKAVGDAVAVDEPVAELETDKITVQLPSPVAGALTEQRFDVGATVKVGDVIGAVDAGKQGKAVAPPAKAVPPPAAVIQAPSGPVPQAVVAATDRRPVARATVPPPPNTTDAAVAPVGQVVTRPASSQSSEAIVQSAGRAISQPNHSGNGEIDREALMKLTPSQRVLARESGALPQPAKRETKPEVAARTPSDDARLAFVDPRDEIVAMSPLRARVAERLVQAQQEAASLTTFNEVDMTAVIALRARYKDSFEQTHGIKLGFMSFFVRACVAACKLYPGVNAEVIANHIVYKKHYDFGIAVQAPKGLVVPVLRGCDEQSFADIERGIAQLAERARTGRLSLADLQGGTFSISNGGIYGSMMSTPLLNYPQTGILGMHNIVKRAVVVGDTVAVRPVMYVALSYDHRVVDGREAVSFLVAVKERLESPERMLVEV